MTCARTSRASSAAPRARPARASPARPSACCARWTGRAGWPASVPRSRSSATTTSPPRRSTSASASSTRPSCARCATTRSATPTASRCWRRSSRSSGSERAPVILGGMSSAAPSSFSRPRRGDELELVVDSLAYGGNGVARLDGYVVFVAGGLPGDRVRAVVGKSKRAYAEARAVEVLEPSPDRLPEVADHPGAPWQVLPYERQLEVKAAQVEEALTRIGHLEGYALEPIVPAVEQWRYRNKLEYSFGTDESGKLVCGFHAPGRFDQILPMTDCKLASERGNELREAVLAECRRQGLGAWDRRDQQGFLRNLVVREGRRTGQFQVRLVTSPGKLDVDALLDAVRCEGL